MSAPRSGEASAANAGPVKSAATKPLTDRLLKFADRHFEVFRSRSGMIFGSRRSEPGRAYQHSPAGSPLMNELKSLFYAEQGKWPDTKASASVSDYLTTQAMRTPPRDVALRSTWNGRRLLIDTGDADWRVIEVDADGWRYREHSPVPFRRSDVTGATPQPAANGSLDDLWALVNVT